MDALRPSGLSAESTKLLQIRGLSCQQMNDFSALLEKAHVQLDESVTAKEVLAGMSAEELELLRKGTSLADPIQVNSLSDEGAANLLADPDRTNMVDLNNDGIVEVGAAKTIVFPPVNAPQHVHEAWEQATENMPEGDKMILQLHMHHLLRGGIQIEGHSSQPMIPPEEQWATPGWQKLLADGRSALEFSVGLEGWTPHNQLKRDFFDRFGELLGNSTQ